MTLRKAEKLRHRTLVDGLFAGGRTLYDYPLRATWKILSREEMEKSFRNGIPAHVAPLQMLITVPKKKIRHAVDRVRIRRRIREAYRLNRLPLLETLNEHPGTYLQIGFIWLHKEEMDYAAIEKKMKRIIENLQKCVGSSHS